MSEWHSIETAPIGELVLTIWDGINNKTGKSARYWAVAVFDGEAWAEPEFGDLIDDPTHWMPLPDPPSTQQSPQRRADD